MDALANTGTIIANGISLIGELVFDFTKGEWRLTKRRTADNTIAEVRTEPLTVLKPGEAGAIYSGLGFWVVHQPGRAERQIVVGDLFVNEQHKIMGIATNFLFNVTPILLAKTGLTDEITAGLNAPIHILAYSVPKTMPPGKAEDFYFLVFDSDGEIVKVEIAFGDGKVEEIMSSPGQPISLPIGVRHAYSKEGEYTVQVKAMGPPQGEDIPAWSSIEFKVKVSKGVEQTERGGVGEPGEMEPPPPNK
jgi:hypothetical protein